MEHIPVAVVRAIIADEQNRVLLLRRRESSQGGGQWCLPGGKVDYDQTVEAAMIHEILEETGLACVACVAADFLYYQDSLPLKPGGMHCINFIFKCVVQGEIVLNAESTEYAWVTPETLQDYTVAFRNDEIVKWFFNTA